MNDGKTMCGRCFKEASLCLCDRPNKPPSMISRLQKFGSPSIKRMVGVKTKKNIHSWYKRSDDEISRVHITNETPTGFTIERQTAIRRSSFHGRIRDGKYLDCKLDKEMLTPWKNNIWIK